MVLGTVSLCLGAWERARDAFGKAAHLFREHRSRRESEALCALGQVHRAQGNTGEALRQFQAAIAVGKGEPMALASALSCLEIAYEDAGQFRAFCSRFQQEHPDLRPALQAGTGAVAQWFLEPARPDARFSTRESGWERHEDRRLKAAIESPRSSWSWRDPLEDCSFTVRNGLEIHAVNGRDLFIINWSAPRWLRSAPRECAVQTVCARVSSEKPALGGILLWKDPQNFLRLDWGARGRDEVSLFGRLQNRDLRVGLQNSDVMIGRGRLSAERVHLRLERRRRDVNALCSADGRDWFTVGRAALAIEEPLMVGPYAIGHTDRTLYPAAHREGTAIRFESFRVWR